MRTLFNLLFYPAKERKDGCAIGELSSGNGREEDTSIVLKKNNTSTWECSFRDDQYHVGWCCHKRYEACKSKS